MKRRIAFGTLALAAIGIAIASRTPSTSAQDEARPHMSGKQLYQTFCIVCHAPRGQGGPMGKSVIDAQSVSYTDGEIISIISDGRPDLGMASFVGALSKEEIFRSMAYVRELQGRNATRLQRVIDKHQEPANPAVVEGEKLFNDKAGCIQCHSYNFRGGVHGPDLSVIGRQFDGAALRNALADPSSEVREGYESKVIQTKDGQNLHGRVRNETAETLQLLNPAGTIWTTYFKADLQSIKDPEASYMPAKGFTDLDESEQGALIAFLETLQ